MGILQKSRLVLLVTAVMVLGAALWIQTVYGATWEAEAQNREGYGKICRISHEEQSVDLISMKAGKSEDKAASEKEIRLPMQAIAEANGFSCGAVADVAVNKKQDLAVLAVQAEDYEAGGTIVFIGSGGTFKGMLECGVQPDMITFTPDGNYVITADKGPQKKGSHKDGEKAQGSVTIANISNGIPSEAKIVTFDQLDGQADVLEPESITVSEDSKTVYIALRGENGVAALDLEKECFRVR